MTEKVVCAETDSSISGFSHCVVFITYGPWYVRFRLLGVYRSNNTVSYRAQSACATCTISNTSLKSSLKTLNIKLNETTLFSQLKSPSSGKAGLCYTLLGQSNAVVIVVSSVFLSNGYSSLLKKCIVYTIIKVEHMYSTTLWLMLALKLAYGVATAVWKLTVRNGCGWSCWWSSCPYSLFIIL